MIKKTATEPIYVDKRPATRFQFSLKSGILVSEADNSITMPTVPLPDFETNVFDQEFFQWMRNKNMPEFAMEALYNDARKSLAKSLNIQYLLDAINGDI